MFAVLLKCRNVSDSLPRRPVFIPRGSLHPEVIYRIQIPSLTSGKATVCVPKNPEAPAPKAAQLAAENEGRDEEKESTLLSQFQSTK